MLGLGSLIAIAAFLFAPRDEDESENAAPEQSPGAPRKHSARSPSRTHAAHVQKPGAATESAKRKRPSAHDRQVAAAREFVSYVQAGGRDRARIKRYQHAMGRLKIDGIIGPKTRARTEDLLQHLVVWPADVGPHTPDPIKDILERGSKPAAKPSKSAPAHVQRGRTALIPATRETHHLPTPRRVIDVRADDSNIETDAQKAASELLGLLTLGGTRDPKLMGTSEHPSVAIRGYQKRMGKLVADGVYGPKTRARGQTLIGKPFPPRLAPYHAAQEPITKPTRKPAAQKSRALPAETLEHRSARGLVAYVQKGGRNRGEVATFQRGMGALDPDGIVGTQTKSRAAAILGSRPDWPAPLTPQGEAPAPSNPVDAARELKAYLDTYHGAHADRIAAYQRAMGGLTADGKAGPKTRARMNDLISKE